MQVGGDIGKGTLPRGVTMMSTNMVEARGHWNGSDAATNTKDRAKTSERALECKPCISDLPKPNSISQELHTRLVAFTTVYGFQKLHAIVVSSNIEDQLALLFQLYQLPALPTFDKPCHDALKPFYRWSFLGTSGLRSVCAEIAAPSSTVDNITLLRHILVAGLYLTHVNCRLSLSDQLPSVDAICLVLTECRLLYVKQDSLQHLDTISLLVCRFFHHGIFKWPEMASPDTTYMLAYPWTPDSEFI
ncbi:hypothetical protein H257_16128 [Aphanomyces astaci]|uniref:Uncharacterized protein n=1 Tax=Aphanomyces astaci TaxID=112090 RepID=W4FJV6_APHAT|nr:hypothetical protein H257_16128 [Aphanomyces astaci]ETV67770.1 hypothetical protein H257_16128 [Aphanomyces astaci]|eukprot:XP_009842763.1 hypothetical protein H257_16128 [Aphanomyces astaci]